MGRRGRGFPTASLRNPFKTYSRCGMPPMSGPFPPKEICANRMPDKYVLAVEPAKPSLYRDATNSDSERWDTGNGAIPNVAHSLI